MSYSETITRTDLTNILNEVLPLPANTRLQFVGDYGSTIFNGTWTATDNGIMIQMLGSNTSGSNAYWYINDTTENKPVGCISFTANGTTNSASFPIVKGHTYGSSAKAAVNSATAYFFKFVTGIFSQADEVDYIVEQGESNGWTYRKWNSGKAECWYFDYTKTSVSFSAWGGLYYADVSTGLSYPFTFENAPYNFITPYDSQAGVFGCWGSSTTGVGTVRVIHNTNNATTVRFHIYTFGTWK